MQTLLNVVEEYLDLKGLEFKKKKTVIVVFWKGGKLRKDDESRFKGDFIKINKEFVYLGVKFFGMVSMHRRLSIEYKWEMCA